MRFFFGAWCLLVMAITPVQAKLPVVKNSADAEQKIQALRTEINTLSKAQREVEEKRNTESKRLRQLDQQVAQSSQSLHKIDGAIDGHEQKLGALETQQQQLEQDFLQQKQQLIQLLRSEYRLGEHSELKHLLAQDSMSQSARWLVYHQYFERQRQMQMQQLMRELKKIADVSTALEQEKQQLAVQKDNQQAVVADLSKQRQQRSVVVTQLDSKYQTQQAKIQALGKDERALRNLLDKLRQASANAKAPTVIGHPSAKIVTKITPKNLTGWPLAGSLLAGYGNALPDGRASEGLLIAATAGSPVYSVAAGRVVYADWLKGYGLLLVIDHGGGYMSLYANNDALLKEVGEAVHAGERVAAVGSSGGQGRAALYFEVRLNGQPQNPNAWLHP